MPLFIDQDRHPGATSFDYPRDGSLVALDQAIDAAGDADVVPGLIEHLTAFRDDAVIAEGRRVLPGLWSLQGSGPAVELLQGALREGGHPASIFESSRRTLAEQWVLDHVDGSVLAGPAGGQRPRLVLTDEDQRFVVPVRPEDEVISVYYAPDFDAWQRLHPETPGVFVESDSVLFEGFYMTGAGSVMGRILQPLRVGFGQLRLGSAAVAGLIVGRIVHARGEGPDDSGDAFFRARRADAEAEHPDLAVSVLDTAMPADRATVFVHGTMSSSFSITADLKDQLGDHGVGQRFRFEHDTLRPINENARELASFIKQLETTDVVLVAHSRGGLVSTTAANFIRDENGWIPDVWTFGTPHQGTPWAAGGYGFRGPISLALSTRAGLSSVPAEIFRLGQILGGTQFRGLADMIPGSPFLQGMTRSDELWAKVCTFAGDAGKADGLRSGPPWLFAAMDKAAQSVLGDPHDTVVEVAASSPHERPPATVFDVDHFSYFRVQQVRALIQKRLGTG